MNLSHNFLYRTSLLVFLTCLTARTFAQAPNISYSPSSQIYTIGTAISAIDPVNSGGFISPIGQTATYAGNGINASGGTTLTTASFDQPLGATIDSQGNLYIAEAGSHLIRKITPGGVVSVFAGSYASGYQDNTDGLQAAFYHPVGMATDAAGNIYVADEDNNMIRKITPSGAVSTFAGGLTQGDVVGVDRLSARFKFPCGIAVAASGNIYVADTYNNKIKKITPAGMVSLFAGSGSAISGDGSGTGASFNQPFSIVVDASENLYVTDRQGQKIRKITQSGVVSTLAGNGTVGSTDGLGAATFNGPTGLAISSTGFLYVTDQTNNRIRRVQLSNGRVTTVSGTGSAGSVNGIGTTASFSGPFALAVNPATGYLYLGDLNNNLIRSVVTDSYTINPALPAGLFFNTSTGTVLGTPISYSPTTVYTVNAYNGYGKSADALLTLTVNAPGAPAFSSSLNYIVNYTPRDYGMLDNSSVYAASGDKSKMNIGVTYMDGLGRPLQSVQVKASPSGNDIIQPVAYDQFGREATKYLPYTATTADGSYRSDAINLGEPKFYNPAGNGTSGAQQTNGMTFITRAFAQTVFEPSPLNRVTEQGAAGIDWQPVAGATTGHTVKIAYTTNNTTALTDTANTMLVSLYTTTINSDQSRTLILNGSYGAGQVYVTVSKDENWKSGRGGTTEEYKDKEGHVVLKRTFNYTGGVLQILSTYYVYDDLGNLAFVLPPGANPDAGLSSANNQAILDNLCYQYRYDERNRLTQKKISGKGWEFTAYNVLDQVVFTQDANQRNKTPQQWTYNKYDAFGRVVINGLWKGSSNADTSISAPNRTEFNSLQGILKTTTSPKWETADGSAATGYTNVSIPQDAPAKYYTINYYDKYTGIPNVPAIYRLTTGVSQMTNGLLTVRKTAVLNTIDNTTPTMLLTAQYYDDLGRSIKTFRQHFLDGALSPYNYDEITTTYNFTNAPTQSIRKHNIKNTSNTAAILAVTVTNNYDYDHMGRKINSWEQITNAALTPDTKILVAKLDYNPIGQLWIKHLHSADNGSTFKQDIAYGYNERGWLSTITAPLFAENLYYNSSNGTPKQYNGNISNQYWGVAGTLDKQSGYTYDQLNRLTSAGATTGNKENSITYDMMGNIKTLNRYTTNTLTDQLTYSYPANSNLLQSVTDATASDIGQKHGTASYTYDGNGNLLSDNSKGIIGITYNLLNLPQVITGKNTTYAYDAAGQKLSRLTGTAKTDYIAGIQYDTPAFGSTPSTISFIQTEEGRALPNGTTAYNYEYSITDHLGNSRVNFDTGTGVARSVQADDYYAFGMEILSSTSGTKNEYLYNKKELQENLGLYDYGARFYDPVIARWTSVDPLAENYGGYSPFSYVLNNPIRMIDPDGRGHFDLNGNWIGDPTDNATYDYLAQVTQRGQTFTWMGSGIGWIAENQLSDSQLETMYQNYSNAGMDPFQGAYGNQIRTWAGSWHGFQSGYNSNAKALDVAEKTTIGATYLIAGEVGAGEVAGNFLINLARNPEIESSVFSQITAKIAKQMTKRGWTTTLINEVVNNASKIGTTINRATGNVATAYFDSAGAYVVKDNVTNEIIQVSNRLDPNWIADPAIKIP